MKINGDQIFDATMDRWQVKMNCSGYRWKITRNYYSFFFFFPNYLSRKLFFSPLRFILYNKYFVCRTIRFKSRGERLEKELFSRYDSRYIYIKRRSITKKSKGKNRINRFSMGRQILVSDETCWNPYNSRATDSLTEFVKGRIPTPYTT